MKMDFSLYTGIISLLTYDTWTEIIFVSFSEKVKTIFGASWTMTLTAAWSKGGRGESRCALRLKSE